MASELFTSFWVSLCACYSRPWKRQCRLMGGAAALELDILSLLWTESFPKKIRRNPHSRFSWMGLCMEMESLQMSWSQGEVIRGAPVRAFLLHLPGVAGSGPRLLLSFRCCMTRDFRVVPERLTRLCPRCHLGYRAALLHLTWAPSRKSCCCSGYSAI